jgi:hypothetical protein
MEKVKQLTGLIEVEQWNHVDVPIELQQLVDKIVKKSASSQESLNIDVPTLEASDLNSKQPEDEDGKGDDDPVFVKPTARDPQMAPQIMVDSKKFYVVSCSLMFVKMQGEYLQCMANIPSLTNDILNRLVEILKVRPCRARYK